MESFPKTSWIPSSVIGFGTGAIKKEDVIEAISTAVQTGYRHFDCAFLYGNEQWIGEALQKCIESGQVKREELFITSKLPMIGNHPDRVQNFANKSLENLGTSYLDLYLIHFPVGFAYTGDDNVHFPRKNDGTMNFDFFTDIVAVWKAMENLVTSGTARFIGLSNFNKEQVTRILSSCTIPPANLQVELHAYFQQSELLLFCQERGIVLSAFAPLGSPGRKEVFIGNNGLPNVLVNPVVMDIATKMAKSPSQILLRHLTQKGIFVIPKSSKPERIVENFQLKFNLDKNDMGKLDSLDKSEHGRSFDFEHAFPGLKYHPENPIKKNN